ncbi:Uncharacterised protein [Bergeriella denitrificans]|uniref:Uncharacterized protein n=1 Tax=Bergeriella denitrificans TaxID=494 RepID=A0A378UE18_BERDE|nr:hypothetical protein [Bergeriella denitrificans]STZ75547.1 Uncharacterised protein [Bergeriella denitrificans]
MGLPKVIAAAALTVALRDLSVRWQVADKLCAAGFPAVSRKSGVAAAKRAAKKRKAKK